MKRYTVRVERTPWVRGPKGHDADPAEIEVEIRDDELLLAAEYQLTGMFGEEVRWRLTIARETDA